MIVPQQAFLQGEPQMQQIPLRNVPKIENTILIQNLDQFVTETMLYQKFKEIGDIAFFKLKVDRTTGESKGQAIVEFRDQKNVEEAINRFNGTTFFDVAVDQNQRKMYVMKKLDKETMAELKQNAQLFFKYQYHGEDQQRLDERRFRDFMSKFGEIQSCKFRQHKGTPLFYGQLIFRQVQDKQNFLNNPENRNIVIDQFTFSFSEYNSKKEQIFSIFLKDFKSQTPLKQGYSQENKNVMLEQVKGFILSQIENEQVKKNCEVFINFDEKHLLPTAFINVKSEEIAEELYERFFDSVLYVKIIYPKGTDKNLNKTLLIHNLEVPKKKILPPSSQKEGSLVQEGGVVQQLSQESSAQVQGEDVKENTEEYEAKLNEERADEIKKALQEIEEERVEEVTENGKTEKKRVKYHPYKNVSVFVFCVDPEKYRTVSVDNSSAASNASSNHNLENSQQGGQNVPQEKVSVPPTQIVWSQRIRQGHILFAKKADAQKFLTQYHTKNYQDKLKHFFLKGAVKFNINISKSMRQQLKDAQAKGQKKQQKQQIEEMALQQAQINLNQFNQMQNYQPMSNQPQTQNNFINPNRQFQQNRPPYGGYNNSNQYQQNNSYNNNTSPNRQQQNNQPPRQYTNYNNSNPRFINSGTGQYQNNQNRNQNQNTQLRNNNFPTQQTQPQTQNKQPSLINIQPQPQNTGNRTNAITHPQQQQQASQQFNTLQEIKNKREAFVQLKEEEQKLILGRLIYPKVQAHLNTTNQNQTEVTQITPKITGMLIDFSVFEIDDIIDMLENEDEFKERIEEAIGLIKNQIPNQN